MAPEVYELIAMGMRYWFVLLALLIAISCWRWVRADSNAYRAALALLPDAGLVGELVDIQTGDSVPLPREGTLGSARACDMRVAGLRKREASLEFEDGKGVRVIPLRGAHVMLDGMPAKGAWALHGTRITVGGRTFRVRLFAGLDVPDRIPLAMPLEAGPAMLPDSTAGEEASVVDDDQDQYPLEAPQAYEPEMAAQQTWQYAVPPELAQPTHDREATDGMPTPARRTRLSRRRRRDRGHES